LTKKGETTRVARVAIIATMTVIVAIAAILVIISVPPTKHLEDHQASEIETSDCIDVAGFITTSNNVGFNDNDINVTVTLMLRSKKIDLDDIDFNQEDNDNYVMKIITSERVITSPFSVESVEEEGGGDKIVVIKTTINNLTYGERQEEIGVCLFGIHYSFVTKFTNIESLLKYYSNAKATISYSLGLGCYT
jgi:hypothetical protein